MQLGPVMLDVQGTALSANERDVLTHPNVGGVILFSRNYENPEQLSALIRSIREIRDPILIAVDQEGGRVQRFHEGFTSLAPLKDIGVLYQKDPAQALQAAESHAMTMANELINIGIDFSFAPVLDVDNGISEVIGNRSFSKDPSIVSILGEAYIKGMHKAGMAATGKHFPGHGSIAADSHYSCPVDERDLITILNHDIKPFAKLAKQLDAIMPAHICYPAVDQQAAGFSSIWLKQILRQQLGFQGIIFSDDLSMAGAQVAGDCPSAAKAALLAGCDMVLVCNNPEAAQQVLEHLDGSLYQQNAQNLLKMLPKITI